MRPTLLFIQVVLGLALISGCTATRSATVNGAPVPSTAGAEESWSPSDLLALAGDAGSRAVEVSDVTALDSNDAIALLGREGDVALAAPSGAMVVSIKGRMIDGYYDGRIVWVVGVYPVEMPLLRGGPKDVPRPVEESGTGRQITVFDANTGEHLKTLFAGGPPVWE